MHPKHHQIWSANGLSLIQDIQDQVHTWLPIRNKPVKDVNTQTPENQTLDPVHNPRS